MVTDQPPYIHAVLCDDVREEKDGRLSIMGVYDKVIALDSDAPAMLRRLKAVIWVSFPVTEPFGHFVLRLVGTPLGDVQYKIDLSDAAHIPPEMSHNIRCVAIVVFEFPEIIFHSSGRIEAFAETDQGTFRIGLYSVQLRDAPPDGEDGAAPSA